jgi:putative endonuclease
MTNNLLRRVREHKTGIDASSFSKKYRLYKLVWFEVFPTPMEAILVEKKIKGWVRNKKLSLIKNKNPDFKDLEELIKG